jgi:hypothetical protein
MRLGIVTVIRFIETFTHERSIALQRQSAFVCLSTSFAMDDGCPH